MQVDVLRLPPGHPLKAFVHSIFHVRDAGPTYRHETILPKGNVDLLFNLGDRMVVQTVGATQILESADVQLAGVQTSGFASRPNGETNIIGLSLRMENASAVLHLPQDEIADRRIEAVLVLPEARQLLGGLAQAADFSARCALLLDWAGARVRHTARASLIAQACRSLRERPSETRVAELAVEAGMSARHFQRIFTGEVGISPSRYVKMQRFVRALHLIPRLPTLTEVAHAAWYTDQAHFCRDFKGFAAMTPDEYRRGKGPVPGHVLIETPDVSDSYKARSGGLAIIAGQEALTDERTTLSSTRPRPDDRGRRLR